MCLTKEIAIIGIIGWATLAIAQVADNPLSATGPGWYDPYSGHAPGSANPFIGVDSIDPSPAIPASYALSEHVHIQMHFALRGEYWQIDSTRWGLSARPTNLSMAWPLKKSASLSIYALMQPLAKAGHGWLEQGTDGEYPITWARIHRGSLQRIEFGTAWRPHPNIAISIGPTYVWGRYQSQSELHYPDSVSDHYMTVVIDRLQINGWSLKSSATLTFNAPAKIHHTAAAYYMPNTNLRADEVHEYGVDISRNGNPINTHIDSSAGSLLLPAHYGIGYALQWQHYRLLFAFEQSNSFRPSGLFRFGEWNGPFHQWNVAFQWKPFRPIITSLYDFRHDIGIYSLQQPFTYQNKYLQEYGLTLGTSFHTSVSASRISLRVHIGQFTPNGNYPHWITHIQVGINIADKWFERPYWD